MIYINNFDEIRPFKDEEVGPILKQLVQRDFFIPLIKQIYPEQNPETVKLLLSHINSKYDFQIKVIYQVLKKLLEQTSGNLSHSGFDKLKKDKAYLIISNHHDIVLDPSVLNVLLYELGFKTTKVAIGDNLFQKDWIKDLARLNKSFVVHRSPPMKQSIYYSQRLSNFIKTSILEEKESIWIAQRQGRAKDGNDVTQVSLLKMLAYGGDENKFGYLKSLNIIPMAISYEYDPCDILKVKELIIKEKNKAYKKTPKEDLISMVTGLTGYKGKIHVALGHMIYDEFDEIINHETSKEQFSRLAASIDEQIQSTIKLWPTNYVAYDYLMGKDTYHDMYTGKEKNEFIEYVHGRLRKAGLEDEESKMKFLSIYANPVKNKVRLINF
jgi:hypothetical protein